MIQIRGNLRTREQNKSALVQSGVRKRQRPGVDDPLAVKEEIEINGALCPALVPDATLLILDGLEQLQQRFRLKSGFNFEHRIQIKPLPLRSTAGLTFVQG